MADPRLVAYIKEQLKEGYSISAIRSYLIKYGYPSAQVDDAINRAYGPAVKHVIHLSKTTLIAVIFIFLGLAIVGTAIFLAIPKAPTQLLDLKINIITTSIQPGDELQFNAELLNLGSAKRYDVNLRHSVIDSKNKLLTTKEETVALETRASIKSEIKINDDVKAGNYLLKTIASYGDKTARATDSFKVYKEETKPTCFDNIQNQGEEEIDCGGPCEPCEECPASCEDNNICTEDYCSALTGYECRHEEARPCCGNLECETGEDYRNCPSDCKKPEEIEKEIKTPWDTVAEIKSIAAGDERRAAELCSGIELETQKDQCFYNIAEATAKEEYCMKINDERTKDRCYSIIAELNDNTAFCEKIVRDSRKDSCYMTFVMNGDYTVCDKVTNHYLKQSCESLRDLSETAPVS